MRTGSIALLAAWVALSANAADEGPAVSGWHAYAPAASRPYAKSIPDPLASTVRPERAPLMHLKPGAACGASEFEVCFDSSGRITVPGAKRFLPVLPGLKPERLSVRRSGIVFGYSF